MNPFRWLRKRRRLKAFKIREAIRKANDPKVYAWKPGVLSSSKFFGEASAWSKLVVTKPPHIDQFSKDKLIGPWRSEVDCEEFCDAQNLVECQNVYQFYSPKIIPPKEKNSA